MLSLHGRTGETRTGDARAGHWQRGSEFGRRQALYAAFDRDLQGQTRFFAAAALTNRLFATLFESPLRWVTAATNDFLNKLSAELEAVNRRFAAEISRVTAKGLNLDALLVTAEQRAAQAHVEEAGKRSAMWPTISRELNALLNGTHVASRAAPLLSHSRRYHAVLGEVRRQLGVGLDFADESHRITIGCTLIHHLRRAAPAEITP